MTSRTSMAKVEHVTFILPQLSDVAVGGYKIVYEYANRLTEYGFKVTICFNHAAIGTDPVHQLIRRLSLNRKARVLPTWFDIDPRVTKKCIQGINDSNVPDADYVIATECRTAEPVFNLSPTKGKKFYLIQNYETWAMPADEIKQTFAMGMNNIVIAKWLKDLADGTGARAAAYIPNPVDIHHFYQDDSVHRDASTISVMFHTLPDKGFSYAWEAIQKAKQQLPGLKVEMFGAYEPPADLPNWVHFTYKASPRQLRTIYSRSSAYVCASLLEGYGLTCVEAIACGCPLVISAFDGARDFAANNESALVSALKDTDTMAANIVKLLRDNDMQQRFAKRGIELTKHLNWETATQAFIDALHAGI